MKEELNKTNSNVKVLTILVIILILLVLGLGGYLVYDKLLSNEDANNSKIETTENNQEKDYDLVEAKKLIDKYTLDNHTITQMIFDSKNIDDNLKVVLSILNSRPMNNSYKCDDALSNLKSDGVTYWLEEDNFNGACFDDSKFYDYNTLNEVYKKLFGNKDNLIKGNISLDTYRFAYSEKYNSYVELSCECGGGPRDLTYYEVVSAKTKGNELNISVKYMLFKLDNSLNELMYYYHGLNKKHEFNGDDENVDTDAKIKEIYNIEKDNLINYNFKFIKDGDNYYLDSIK